MQQLFSVAEPHEPMEQTTPAENNNDQLSDGLIDPVVLAAHISAICASDAGDTEQNAPCGSVTVEAESVFEGDISSSISIVVSRAAAERAAQILEASAVLLRTQISRGDFDGVGDENVAS
eukprot:FR739996.1.p4 GENE.FR739996.1~~FR739996.1.p4  ORF type:complete len:120 (+),score=9.03 FR739996.1:141-500(+)